MMTCDTLSSFALEDLVGILVISVSQQETLPKHGMEMSEVTAVKEQSRCNTLKALNM